MINLRKLADQQNNQRSLKTKNRILKQTHDIKLAESLSSISKKLEVNKSTQKISDVIKESNSEKATPQLAIENNRNDIQPGILYATALENTLANMKKQKGFFKIEERANGDLLWNKKLFEILGDSTVNNN